MKEQLPIGKLIDGPQERDAIHVAIAPVVAAEPLVPGEHIGFVGGHDSSGEQVTSDCSEHIGIVDPFLRAKVKKGQRFWMFLYPNTITSLRHNWTHPSFESVLAGEKQQSTCVDARTESEKWLRDYAARMNCYEDPEKAFETLMHGLRSGELFAHGSDLHSLSELNDADELRHHAEIYLGKRIDWGTFSFSCSC